MKYLRIAFKVIVAVGAIGMIPKVHKDISKVVDEYTPENLNEVGKGVSGLGIALLHITRK
jgi:hypothetical protein